MDAEDREERGTELEEIYGSPLPKCCGTVTFIGNEAPDGKWIKLWKAWFKCSCGRVFSERRSGPFEVMFSTMR